MFEGFRREFIRVEGVRLHAMIGGPGEEPDGSAPPLLLVHGFPQSHVMWHALAPALAERFTVVCPDLRGYGLSDKPDAGPDHAGYAKRAMAADLVRLMGALGYDRFAVVAHDRGARASHRMALDHPDAVTRLCLIDIMPTLHVFETVDQTVATAYEHWFSLLPTDGVPEHLIGLDPEFYLTALLRRWSASTDGFAPEAVTEYIRAFSPPEAIHAMCEDYRAGASIDLVQDREDREAGHRIECPLHLIWGARGLVGRHYDVTGVWQTYADGPVTGTAIDCGHFVPEEKPAETLADLEAFLA